MESEIFYRRGAERQRFCKIWSFFIPNVFHQDSVNFNMRRFYDK